MDAGHSPRKTQEDWGTFWMDTVAKEGNVKDPSSDSNGESHVEFKSSGTRLYENMEDIMLIASKF